MEKREAAYLEIDAAWAGLETAAAHLDYAYRNAPLLLLDPRHAQTMRAFNQARMALTNLRAYAQAKEEEADA